jgi:hypothetical protein
LEFIYYPPKSISLKKLKQFIEDVENEKDGIGESGSVQDDPDVSDRNGPHLKSQNTSNISYVEQSKNKIKKFTFDEDLTWDSETKEFRSDQNLIFEIISMNLFDEACLLYFTRITSPVSKIPLLYIKDKVKWIDNSLNIIINNKT